MRTLDLAPSRVGVAVGPQRGLREPDRDVHFGPALPVRLVDLQPGPTAVVRATMRPDAVTGWLGGAYRRLARALRGQQVGLAGPAFARYTVDGDLVEVEAGFRIPYPITGGTGALASGLPGGLAAVATHLGDAGSLDAVYDHLDGWLDACGLVVSGPHWEVYPAGPHLASTAGPIQVVVPCRRRDGIPLA